MGSTFIGKAMKWAIPAVALGAGVVIGQQRDFDLTSAAHAAKGMTPLERLLIQDDIRQKIVLYGLYADGDGPGGAPRDLRKLAETLMTPDVVSEIYLAKGGAPIIHKGREIVANTPPEIASEHAKTVAGRHYLIETIFDEVTPTMVKTRTPAAYFDTTRNVIGPACTKVEETVCGGKPVKTVLWVYHQTWVKTPQGWQISKNILRDDN